MPRTQTPTYRSVKQAATLVGDIVASARSLQQAQALLCDGLRPLLNAKLVLAGHLAGLVSDGNLRTWSTAASGWADAAEIAAFEDYLREGAATDPVLAALSAQPRPIALLARRDVLDDDSWHRNRYYNEHRLRAGVDDCVLASTQVPRDTLVASSSRALMLGAHRARGDTVFTRRHRALMEMVCTGLAPTLLKLEARERSIDALPDRLRELFTWLTTTAKTEKEIASEMGLSPGTVHQYTRRLLATLGADSRIELMVRFSQ